MFTRYIALGDSMTEGMTDEIVNGHFRGWADRIADVMATKSPNFTYMNLAVRGKLIQQVIDNQLPQIKQYVTGKETLVSFHAGANDVIRPNYNPAITLPLYIEAAKKVAMHFLHQEVIRLLLAFFCLLLPSYVKPILVRF